MPKGPVPTELEAVLVRPNPAIVATVRPDGQPVTVATWYAYQNGRILLNMDAARKRVEYLRNDPRISLTVLNGDDWYSHISVQGRVIELSDDTDLSGTDLVSNLYTGKDHDRRDRARVNAWVEIDSWHVWGKLAQS
jgi:PPOX class probable F420-dependent enzyme